MASAAAGDCHVDVAQRGPLGFGEGGHSVASPLEDAPLVARQQGEGGFQAVAVDHQWRVRR